MKRVILECKGRLANQLLCWANAMHVFAQLGIKDRLIVLTYPELEPLHFPCNTAIETLPELTARYSALPRVKRDEIAIQTGDCLWIWEDIYCNLPCQLIVKAILQTIMFPVSFNPPREHCIGIHVRYGDYEKIDHENPPSSMPPFLRAPNDYFLDAISICRQYDPRCKFYLASDGTPQELLFLTAQEGVFIGHKDDALKDLFYLSQCRLIIGSNSTFSHVAAYYGNIPVTSPSMSHNEMREMIACAL
jgi:glycosyl transferase family 11